MKTLNQIREYALKRLAELETDQPADGLDKAKNMDDRDYHATVLVMCDRMETLTGSVLTADRNAVRSFTDY